MCDTLRGVRQRLVGRAFGPLERTLAAEFVLDVSIRVSMRTMHIEREKCTALCGHRGGVRLQPKSTD